MSSEMSKKHAETLKAVRSVFDGIPAPCAERDALDFAIALLARTEAGADGAVAWTDDRGLERLREGKQELVSAVRLRSDTVALYTRPQDASVDAEWRELLTRASNYIDTLGGDSKTYRAAMQAKEAK